MNRLVSRILTSAAVAVVLTALLASCSSTRHVPQGKLLLDKVKINIADPRSDVEPSQLVGPRHHQVVQPLDQARGHAAGDL